jgi:hypothetical protein
MKNKWERFTDEFNEFSDTLADLLNILPESKSFWKARTDIENKHRMLKRPLNYINEFFSEGIEAVDIKGYLSKDFQDTWSVYKDYLREQHGIIMRSRMELMRLKWLIENTEKDTNKMKRWLEFYMATGSASIFKIKEEENENDTKRRATFTIRNTTTSSN